MSDYRYRSINGFNIRIGSNCPAMLENMLVEIAEQFGDEPTEEIRHHEHQVTLSNQTIIEFAYAHADLIAPLIENRNKLCFEQANCYCNIYYRIRKLLKVVDPEYLEEHAKIVGFYRTDLSNDWDVLAREIKP